jgi:tetratricopeptide (TPR) repeat protein
LALEVLYHAEMLEPGDPNFYFHRGTLFKQLGDWDVVVSELTVAIEHRERKWPELWGRRGDVYREVGDVVRAREHYLVFLEMAQGDEYYADWIADIETWLAQHP